MLADVASARLASALNLVSRLASTQPASCSAARRSLSARRRPHATAVPSAVPERSSGFARATVAACFNQPSKCGAPSGSGGMRGAKVDGGGGGGGAGGGEWYSYMGEKVCARTDKSEAWACTLSMLCSAGQKLTGKTPLTRRRASSGKNGIFLQVLNFFVSFLILG